MFTGIINTFVNESKIYKKNILQREINLNCHSSADKIMLKSFSFVKRFSTHLSHRHLSGSMSSKLSFAGKVVIVTGAGGGK